MPSKKNIVFGLIGTGGISQNQHLPNLKRAEHVCLKTICDLQEDVLEQMQSKYDVPNITTDYKTVLVDPEIEVVLVATKGELHVPLTIEALKAGKHVYVEKPLAETAEDCQRIIDAREKADKYVAVGFNRRRAPSFVKAKEIALANGGPRHMHYRIADSYYKWKEKYRFPPGYRIVVEICHIFDLMRYFADSEVKSVYCATARADDETIILQFESGTVASIMSSGYVEPDMPKECLEMIVDLGCLTVNECVELKTFGLNNCERRYCFEGLPIPCNH